MRFAILEHRQIGSVHFDLLFEQPSSDLRTWSVDCPPHSGWQACTELPPHRTVYLNYEGPISRSRGWVRRWDAGIYQPMTWQTDDVRVLLKGAELIGLLELERMREDVWRCRFTRSV
jgi:hypothetical protein